MDVASLFLPFTLRAIERLVIVGGGILAIWLGYRLFSLIVADHGTLEAKSGQWMLRLQRVGPGVFFALFGAGVLGYAMATPITVNWQDGGKTQIMLSGDSAISVTDESRAEDVIRAVTMVQDFISRSPDLTKLDTTDRGLLNSQLRVLLTYRESLIDAIHGVGTMEWYIATYQAVRENPAALDSLSEADRKKYERIRKVMQPSE